MSNLCTTTLVVPCYNEAKRLNVDSFLAFEGLDDGVKYLFVNDGSSDDTQTLLERMRDARPDVIDVHVMEKNSGKAEAVRVGMLRAAEANPDVVGFWDADLSTGLDELAAFRTIMSDRDDLHMVFGSRVNLLGRNVRRKLLRHYIGRGFATVAAWGLRLPIYDTQCGAKIFRCTDEMRERLAAPFISNWIFDVEILARYIAGRRGTDLPQVGEIVYECPLDAWYDVEGSKIRLRNFFTAGVDLTRIMREYMWR